MVLPDGTELEDSIPLEHYALPRMAAVQVELKQQPLGAAPLAGAGEARVRRLAGGRDSRRAGPSCGEGCGAGFADGAARDTGAGAPACAGPCHGDVLLRLCATRGARGAAAGAGLPGAAEQGRGGADVGPGRGALRITARALNHGVASRD